MRYSIEPKDRIYVKGYRFLSFAKNMNKNRSSKYGQKLLDSAKKKKKSTTGAIKTASKKAIQKKTAEATGDLIGNKIADKITSVLKKSSMHSQNNETNDELETPKERYISPEKRQKIINELRLA